MIKSYAKSAMIMLCMGVSSLGFSQSGNISMNIAGTASTNPAILDLSDASNAHLGFLLPNVSLASNTDIITIPGPTTGMIIWNTNSGMPFGVGYYYWDGSNWDFLYSSGSAVAGAALSPSIGLTGSIYNGSAAVSDWAVNYGSTAGSAVQGNTTITITAGSGLSGGGTVTEGAGGTITLTNTGVLPSLSNDFIWTGNASSVATAVQMSGDATMANTGAVKVKALESATTSVNVSTAAAPTNGQVLTASSGTAAAWATPSTVATSVPFSGITSGTNSSASMTVTSGASLTYSLNGTINATGVETFTTGANSTAFPLFVNSNNNGGPPQSLVTNVAYTYNPGTQTLSATNFIGASASLVKASQAGVLVVGDAEATPKTATIQAPGTITTTYTLNLPTTGGTTVGQVLGIPTTAGQLGWVTPNAGTVTGSGTATQVAFWSSASALSSNTNLYWDNTNDRLGIKNSSPLTTLDVSGALHVSGETPNVTQQGGYISWNNYLPCCNGEMDFINNKGGGSGGFMFFNSTNLTAPLLFINSSGAIMPNNLAGTSGQVLTSAGAGSPPTWTTIASAPAAANPTASVILTAVNGSATTYMRSDAAPALSQAIIPTWTGLHTFTAGITSTGTTAISISGDATATTVGLGSGAGAKTVTLGSTNTTSSTAVQSGSGGVNVNASNNQPTNINTGTSTGTVSIGNGTNTTITENGNYTLNGSNGASTTNIGTGTTTGVVSIAGSANRVGIGNNSPNAKAIVDLTNSQNLGVMLPGVTTANLPAITAAQNGLELFNTTTGCIEYVSGGVWNVISGHGYYPFSFTGAQQTWTVPSCVTSITVIASGAAGGGSAFGGGNGAVVTATVTVVSGHTLDIVIGGLGGTCAGGAGGGGTFVWDNASTTNPLVVVGGGGGGGNSTSGGPGSTTLTPTVSGTEGAGGSGGGGGTGGLATKTGPGGGGGGWSSNGTPSSATTTTAQGGFDLANSFAGGAGATNCNAFGGYGGGGGGGENTSTFEGGGGGGGGYNGGGGGSCTSNTSQFGGGGGGSGYYNGTSFVAPVTVTQTNTGNGSVIIMW